MKNIGVSFERAPVRKAQLDVNGDGLVPKQSALWYSMHVTPSPSEAMRVLILCFSAILVLAAPAAAVAAINPAPVASCLAKNAHAPDACLAVVFEPCARVVQRDQPECLRGITFEWLRLAELRTRRLLNGKPFDPTTVNHKPLTNEMLKDSPGCEVSSYRQGVIDTRDLGMSLRLCILLAVARTWHVVETNPPGALQIFQAFVANRERLKACVKWPLGGDPSTCIGLVANGCIRTFPARLCDDQEAILWESILTETYARLGPDLAKALLSANNVSPVDAEICGQDLDRCARELRDQNGRRAILLFLAAESE